MGNASTLDILHVLRTHQQAIAAFDESGDDALLVLPAIDLPQ
jgi:hypothetical protein